MSESGLIHIPARAFSSLDRRAEIEEYLGGTPLAGFAHEFVGQENYHRLVAADLLGEGVLTEMTREYSEGFDFRVFRVLYHNTDHSLSMGRLFFGASSRERADRAHPDFIGRINNTLGWLGADIRLDIRPTLVN